jgi:iron complex transport system permease protein
MTSPTTAPVPAGPVAEPPDPAATASSWRPAADRRGAYLIGGLAVLLPVVVIIAAARGAYEIPLGDAIQSVLHKLHLGGTSAAQTPESVLWDIRFPRVALAVIVGGSLGCAGALLQGGFSNPLAEPGVIGVSSGAAMGAVVVIALGLSPFGSWSIVGAAFLGGLVTVIGVYLASREHGRIEVVTVVLTGIAVNAATGAVIGLMMFFSDDAQLRSITFWTLGSLAQATWSKVAVVAPLAAAGAVAAPALSRRLDLLALGDRQATHLGVDVHRLRLVVLILVASLTAAAVAVAGILSFVGLVVPHLVRMVAGPRHRTLIVASTLGGASVLVIADLAARTIAAPAEVPLGVLTALVGSPFFFWQLRRTRSSQGGWA